MNRTFSALFALLMAFVLFLAVNALSDATLRGARLDLTENKLYTLSDGTRNILKRVEEPIRLRFYYSEAVAGDVPGLRVFAKRILELLREYERAAKGKIRLEVVDPEPFSEAEDMAQEHGMRAYGIDNARSVYLGLRGANSVDQEEVIPFFSPDRKDQLEYDITKMVQALTAKKTVGVMSWLPIEGREPTPAAAFMGGGSPPWMVVEQIRELYETRTIAMDATEIPADIDALLVVHPKNPSPQTLYAIDQYLMRGGSMMLFVDPHCLSEELPPAPNPMQAMMQPRESNLEPILTALGVRLVPGKVVGDRASAMSLPASVAGGARQEMVDVIYYLGLDIAERVNRDDPATKDLARPLAMAAAGILERIETKKAPEGEGAEKGKAKAKDEGGDILMAYTPLIQTSVESTRLDVSAIQVFPDARKMLADFVSEGKELHLAARVKGLAKSAFPEGPPAPPEGKAPPAYEFEHLAKSAKPLNAIIVADADMLANELCARIVNLLGMRVAQPFSDNAAFALNALDDLSGNAGDLAEVRGNVEFARPFTRMEELRRKAEQKYQAKVKELEEDLDETRQKLAELQAARGGGEGADAASAGFILTPEQRAEIAGYEAKRLEIRKELRGLQHDLGKDIESLQARLKFYNIALMPLLVGCVAVGLGAWRIQRRRSKPRLD